MGRSNEPLKRILDARVDEARIHAAWNRIDARIHAPARPQLRAPVLALGGLVLAALVLAVSLRSDPPPRFLALADGAAPAAVRTDAPGELAFADDSRIALGARSSLVPTRNDATRFHLLLERGSARFSVTPEGPRTWLIDCGLAEVEVVGTVFAIDRGPDRVRVSVERGVVRVRAESIGMRELRAGDSIEVREPIEPVVPTPVAIPEIADPDTIAIEPSMPPEPTREVPASTRDEWSALARDGAYDRAYDALGPSGVPGELERAAPRELLLLADVARLSGHAEEAVAPLRRLIDENPGDPSAPIAAIVLGRLHQDALHHPVDAVRALERAIELGVPASLELDVQSRLALALLDAGDPRGEAAVRAYLEAFPDGPRAASLRTRIE